MCGERRSGESAFQTTGAAIEKLRWLMDVFARETNKFRVSASPSVCPFAAAVANTDRPTPFECDVALSHLEDRQIYRTKGHCDHMPQISN